MAKVQYVEDDFVVVREAPNTKAKRKVTLAFGDAIEVLGKQDGWTKVKVLTYFDGPFEGFVEGELPVRNKGVLGVSMIDVQQGDGLILETPGGKIVFVDGGDNKLFARHAAARFRHRGATADNPLEVDLMIITHGDADHFDGLNEFVRSEKLTGAKAHKRLFIHPKRIYHNGLVKGPTEDKSGKQIPDKECFGHTVLDQQNNRLMIIDLYNDPRDAPESALNAPFKRWAKSLNHWQQRRPIELKRIAFGMNEDELFGFLHEEGVKIELQGPFAAEVVDPANGECKQGLLFLHRPKKSAVLHLERGSSGEGSLSASHTINGHSIALRLTYGNVRFNLTGDLNQESMELLLGNLEPERLEAEIVKAPHHGSHDFDFLTLQAMRPVVAIVSSGDENVRKEHIHPRATLMAALGKSMRCNTGIVLCTELAAFFAFEDLCYTREALAEFFKEQKDQVFTGEELRKLFTGKQRPEDPPGIFYGFKRANFGIIFIRTDGERVLVFTHSGKEGLNEAYRFKVINENGERVIRFAKSVKTR